MNEERVLVQPLSLTVKKSRSKSAFENFFSPKIASSFASQLLLSLKTHNGDGNEKDKLTDVNLVLVS